jgi:hypothetical protein
MPHPFRALLFCLACAVGGSACADDLADAARALDQKNYPVALKLFDQLAAAGNSEAQLRLGEMYWYGEGVSVDRAKADGLFAKAAAAGNPAAIAAARLSARRAASATAIAYWTGGYTGAELREGAFACPAPVIPARSVSNDEIRRVGAEIGAWTTCYNGLVANINSLRPAGKAIPEDVLELMNEQDLAQARQHLDIVYKRVAAAAEAEAAPVLAKRESWHAETAEFVRRENATVEQNMVYARRELVRREGERGQNRSVSETRTSPGPQRR